MIFIYKELVRKYIIFLKPQDIINYAKKQKVDLSNDEVMIIYRYLKKYYNELLDKNTESFVILKKSLRSDLYNKLVELYNSYKNYI